MGNEERLSEPVRVHAWSSLHQMRRVSLCACMHGQACTKCAECACARACMVKLAPNAPSELAGRAAAQLHLQPEGGCMGGGEHLP